MADPKPLIRVCPCCGFFAAPEAFALDDDNKLYSRLIGKLGNAELAQAVEQYLSLFRPAQRRLTAPRARKLLSELVPMLSTGTATVDGRHYTVPAAAWIAAIDEMLRKRDQLTLPMESHNWLIKAAIARASGQADRRTQVADQLTGIGAPPSPRIDLPRPPPAADAGSGPINRDLQLEYAAAAARKARGYATAADLALIDRVERAAKAAKKDQQ